MEPQSLSDRRRGGAGYVLFVFCNFSIISVCLNPSLFLDLELRFPFLKFVTQTMLKVLKQWMCSRCMKVHLVIVKHLVAQCGSDCYCLFAAFYSDCELNTR